MKRGLKLSACLFLAPLKATTICLSSKPFTEDYNDLHAYSVSTYTFWLDVWDFMGIIASVPPQPDQVRGYSHQALVLAGALS